MSLVVPGKWIWDFWFAQDGADYHIFYLQADRSLNDERLRHWNVSIGHAVSQDLINWEILPDALKPSSAPAWDDKTTWTGSIIKHDGLWYMFYTGARQSEDGLKQRIGLATSKDLLVWAKHPDNPLIEVDPQWYEELDLNAWHDQAWRDPYIYKDEATGRFHAFITARANRGPGDGRGVVGHATSLDLINWTVGPPVTPTGEYGHLEVPQLVFIDGRYYMLFSCPIENFSHQRRNRLQEQSRTGTFYLTADSLTGPYTYDTERVLFGDAYGSLYSGKLIQRPDDSWCFVAFRNFEWNGEFIGDIIDPLTVTIDEHGRLQIDDH